MLEKYREKDREYLPYSEGVLADRAGVVEDLSCCECCERRTRCKALQVHHPRLRRACRENSNLIWQYLHWLPSPPRGISSLLFSVVSQTTALVSSTSTPSTSPKSLATNLELVTLAPGNFDGLAKA
jgi:hypothetical protein